jgi:predicted nuclease of predicted toxin-antitoxin system
MKILIDMILSPAWVDVLNEAGHEAVHWSAIGNRTADDTTLLDFARDHGQVLLTHDLDFAALLASTRGTGPSVLQVRTHNVLPDAIGTLVLSVLNDYADAVAQGALVSVDEVSARVRILPIR